MDYSESQKVRDFKRRSWEFREEYVLPAEPVYAEHKRETPSWGTPPVVENLKKAARDRGLWNLFCLGITTRA